MLCSSIVSILAAHFCIFVFLSLFICAIQLFNIEMEIIPEGVHFRLVQDDELPAILGYLKQYLPESIKVCVIVVPLSLYYFHFQLIFASYLIYKSLITKQFYYLFIYFWNFHSWFYIFNLKCLNKIDINRTKKYNFMHNTSLIFIYCMILFMKFHPLMS